MASAFRSASPASSSVSLIAPVSSAVTVDDEIVIKLVQDEIAKHEAAHDSWFIQGFPRTKVQALALQRLRIVPDKFIHLNIRQSVSLQRISAVCSGENSALYGQELNNLAVQIYADYTMNINAVRDSFKQFIFEFDADGTIADTQQDLYKMLKLRYRNGAPRRPPRVILIGPPGSGRTTQAQILADTFGLVHICPAELVKVDAEQNPGIKLKIKEAVQNGEQIPDEIMLRLIDARLRMSDCRVNGWVLDGFPQTEAQVNLLRSMRVKPSLVVLFEQSQDESITRLGNRRLDPRTGELYNMEIEMPKSEVVNNCLVKRAEDSEVNVRKRYHSWNQNISMLEESFKQCLLATASDKTVEAVSEKIMEAVENPVF
jgi:adenylate kinase